ncbi:hypothetical protein BT63DRAFT_420711 [Microthyrium microscopicum]|uniref:Uncharacterized protein n=1 Tax=Microthyrium microscopicum TaxID=703497 RepID=A0A6A6UX04_9PEZI|nr:hypothetical protein BT63DRAFT_420711 [Microthyrium microscopicum]
MSRAIPLPTAASDPPLNNLQRRKAGLDKRPEGQGLFATRACNAGAHLHNTPRITLGIIEWDKHTTACANCFGWEEDGARQWIQSVPDGSQGELTKIKMCARCKTVGFCGRECQEMAWGQWHKHECKTLAKLGASERDVLKEELTRGLAQLLIMNRKGTLMREDWDNFQDLQGGYCRPKKTAARLRTIVNLAMKIAGITETTPIGGVDGAKPGLAFAFTMADIIKSNAYTLTSNFLDPLGMAFCPLIARANHSCAPNAFVTQNGQAASIRALRPIAKNEEVTIAYVDTSYPFHTRQRELETTWAFTCACPLCVQGSTTWRDVFPLRAQAREEFKEEMREILKLAAPRALEASKGMAGGADTFGLHDKDEDVRIFTAADMVAEAQGRTLDLSWYEKSGVWPMYRQPYTEMVQTTMLSEMKPSGKWLLALKLSVQLAMVVDPVQRPEEHDPLRLMHYVRIAIVLHLLPDVGMLPFDREKVQMGLAAAIYLNRIKAFGAGTVMCAFLTWRFGGIVEPHIKELSNKDSAKSLHARKDMEKMRDWAAKTEWKIAQESLEKMKK